MSASPVPTTLPPLSNREVRELKSRAQRLDAVTKLGKAGMSEDFLAGVDRELTHHELIKIRLTELKAQRFDIAEQIASRTRAHLIGVIGHVVVLYRPTVEPIAPADSSTPAHRRGTSAPAGSGNH